MMAFFEHIETLGSIEMAVLANCEIIKFSRKIHMKKLVTCVLLQYYIVTSGKIFCKTCRTLQKQKSLEEPP